MNLFSFYNMRKPRTFNYTPAFFDPKKEEMDERIAKAKKELGIDIPLEEFKPNVKGTMVRSTHHLRRRLNNPEKSSSKTNIILAVILVVLLILFFYYFI